MPREEIKINKLVGEKNNEFYFLDYVFDEGNNFKGAKGTILVPISQEEYKERTTTPGLAEWLKEAWKYRFENDQTALGLEEWAEEVYSIDGDDAVFDLSYSNTDFWQQIREVEPDLTEEDFPLFECIGGGRCFSKNMEFEKVYNPELIELINKYEEEEV